LNLIDQNPPFSLVCERLIASAGDPFRIPSVIFKAYDLSLQFLQLCKKEKKAQQHFSSNPIEAAAVSFFYDEQRNVVYVFIDS
jgi:hypothetical protein